MGDYVDNLSDAELRTKLAEYGFPVVPITNTTRKVMAKKLKMLIENKNKINSEGRRSLAKYSSEEESDDEAKQKKDRSRRATVGGAMLPPAVNKSRKSIRKVDSTTNDDVAERSIVTETKTRRTTRIIQPVVEADGENYSDSEPEIVEEYIKEKNISPQTRTQTTYISDLPKPTGTSSYLSARSPLGQSASVSDYGSRTGGTTTTSYLSSTRYTSPTSDTYVSGDCTQDKFNQIRSRLSASTSYDRPFERRTIGSYGDGDAPADTPFLSNFSKRLSQISAANNSKSDYNYKNDIIKEHDANGSSSYSRSYLSRVRNRDYSQDFKTSQEKNILKNNFVSFALVSIACAFFMAIMILYWGMKTDQPAIGSSGYIIPYCTGRLESKPGINCVRMEEKQDALNLLRVLLPELTKRAITHMCSDQNLSPHMGDQDIIDFVSSNYALKDSYEIKRAIDNLQVIIFKNPELGISIITLNENTENGNMLVNMDDIIDYRIQNTIALMVSNPDLPLRCIIYNKLSGILKSVLFIIVGFAVLFSLQKLYKYMLVLQKRRSDEVFTMVEKIIDILQANATDTTDGYLAVNHVRDMLIFPQDRKRLSGVWNKAVKFLQENESRVRTEIQIVSGEEFHVWRWLGNPGLSPNNSARSKSWQGQAFETQVGSVNSLPCSPTACLKIRGMFDEREKNLYTVRDAVLAKCAHKCKILHCEADLTSGCVYLKCANQAEAAVAYQNLHGWWYDGHLVTVKYLRLERYMQRFPNSPTVGPPYLTSTNKILSKD